MAQNINYIQNSFGGGEWDPQMSSKIDLAKYKTACKTMRNFFAHVNGAASNRQGTIYIASTKFSTTSQSAVKNVKLIPFQFSTNQSYMLEFGDYYIRFYKNGSQILSGGNPYEVATSYPQSAVMSIGYTQSADTLFLAHPSYTPMILQRVSDTNWTFSAYQFTGGPFQFDNTNTAYSLSASSTTGSVTLTATGFTPFVAGHVGSLWQLFHYVPNQSLITTLSGATSTASISCGGTYRLITNGTWTGTIQVEKSLDGGVTWLALNNFSSVANFNVNTYGTEDMSNNAPPFLVRVTCIAYTSGTINITLTADPFIQPGIIKINTVSSSTVALGTVQQPIGLANTKTTDWAEGSWSTYRGFPSTVEFTADDRLMWANSPTFPQSSWASKTSNYYNFNVSNPLVDSDSLNLTLPSRQLNAISSLVSLRAMLALTSSGEWSIESTQGVGNPLTPTSTNQRVHGFEGAQAVRPILIGNRAIFVQFLGKIIRDIGYELVYDSFVGANLSIFSNHLFQFNTITDMAYQKNPDSMVWMVRNDGNLISLTYLREQQMVSFARHDTNGSFMCVASLANSLRNFDEVWFVVNRNNGQFIEYLSQRSITSTCNDGETHVDIANQVFMDCTVQSGATRIAITSITIGTNITVTTNIAHGYSNNSNVKIFNLTINTQLNNTSWIIGNVTTYTFDLIVQI